MSITQEIALGVFLGNIAEYQNRTENLIVRSENRRRAVGNVISCPILGEQVGVVASSTITPVRSVRITGEGLGRSLS